MEGNLLTGFKENRTKIANCLFYVALTIELLLMILEKSEISFSYESHVFRVTFLLTLLAVLVMRHDLKEWAVIALILGLAAYCYLHTGRNDLLRLSLFIMAARDIDLKRAMKYCFYVCLVGFLAIALLAVAGILGDVALTADYGRSVGVETRYVFGFGHPNTLFSSVYALILMWIWIYGKTAGVLPYLVAVVSAVVVTGVAGSRTGALILAMTMALAILTRVFGKLAEKKWPYILGGLVSPVSGALLAAQAAWLAGSFYYVIRDIRFHELAWKLDVVLNRRIGNLYYATSDHGGIFDLWTPFSEKGFDQFFDMGWNRLVYWYGIIPTVIMIAAMMAVVYVSMKERDIRALILMISLGIYTLVEATFVTRYLGRDFFLLIAGVYLGRFFADLFKTEKAKGATDA